MVWAAFSGAGKWTIAFIEGRQDALGYHNTLENYMMPFVYCFHGEKFTFQQDGASIHTANVTKEWFKSLDIDLLDWPARSPDLNPIEILRSVFARDVYRGCRQFHSQNDLHARIVASWKAIPQELLDGLYT